MSTSDEKVWQTTAIQNLVRYRPSGTYFARFRVGGKLVWKSLKTSTFSVAKQPRVSFETAETKTKER